MLSKRKSSPPFQNKINLNAYKIKRNYLRAKQNNKANKIYLLTLSINNADNVVEY